VADAVVFDGKHTQPRWEGVRGHLFPISKTYMISTKKATADHQIPARNPRRLGLSYLLQCLLSENLRGATERGKSKVSGVISR
jgi:hypothetical protein